jgi:cytochrome P450
VPCIQKCITKRIAKGRHHDDLIGCLIDNGGVFEYTPDEIAGIVLLMLTAGTMTTKSLVSWTIKYLHDYPDAREFIQVTVPTNLAFSKCLFEISQLIAQRTNTCIDI